MSTQLIIRRNDVIAIIQWPEEVEEVEEEEEEGDDANRIYWLLLGYL